MYLYLAVYVCLTCDGCIFIWRGMYVYLECMYVCLPGDVCRQQNPTASMCRPVYQRVTSVISVETSLLCKRIREAWTDAHCYSNNYSNINHRPHCSTEELFQSMITLLNRGTVPINEHIAHSRNSSDQLTHCSLEEQFRSMNTLLTRGTVPINEHNQKSYDYID